MKLPQNKPIISLWIAGTLLGLALACNASYAELADRDKPMHLEANRASIDDKKQISTFEGKVQLSQGTLTITGDKLVVLQGKEGYTRGTATGQPASFRQKREKQDEYVEGYGERIEYDGQNETVDIFGQARLKQGQDEVHGEHITYSSKTEIFQVHGATGLPADTSGKSRVRIIIQPRNKGAAAPPAETLPIQPVDTLKQHNDRGNLPP